LTDHEQILAFADVGRYEVLKENLCRNLRNFRQTQPYLQTHYYSGLLLSSRQWSKEQVLACAEVCDVERLNQFIREALQAIHVEALVYGNNTKEEALKVIDGIVAELKTVPKVRPLFTCELHQNREHQIPKGITV
uniref:Insulin-degrading enzyme (inferred by orthology to a human protein) n=1 Tax=Anisakis simplex TaxID=6269 RepID=A0A0M3JIK0_ANISI